MVNELLYLIPDDPGTVGLVIALAGSLVGAGIWLVGARYSRSIITLLTVLLGASVGMHLPEWCGWEISGAGPAVGGALVLGVTGYVLHGMWVGIGLGAVLCSWTAMACWIAFRSDAGWVWPEVEAGMSFAAYCARVWAALPPDVARVLPFACATAMFGALATAILWPKTALILGWSMAGTTLLIGMGLAAMESGRPQWLTAIPSHAWAQAALVAAVVGVGALFQWKFSPKPAPAGPSSKKKQKKPAED